jgi:hypothetical protein
LGRPKFLSDEIYGKTIFGQLYQSRSDFNELGPAAGSAQWKRTTK